MKTIIRKELRELSKLGVLGLIILAFILTLAAHNYSVTESSLARASTNVWDYYQKLQPLLAPGFHLQIGCFCALLGAVLGFLQIFAERHRDLWAFLIHRPVTRSAIFSAKVIAGLGLYFAVAGLPLLCFVLWAHAPGNVAAPFEWSMTLPLLIYLLFGAGFYFAGMLTAVRQARWYGSRTFGFGLAALLVPVAFTDLAFWLVLLIIVIGLAILAFSAWGSFQSHGYYSHQPLPGRLALTLTLLPGSMMVIAAVAILIGALFGTSGFSYSRYVVTHDGKVWLVTYSADSDPTIKDLAGKPVLDEKTGQPMKMSDFQKMIAPSYHMTAQFGAPGPLRSWRHDSSEFFQFWSASADTLWFYWNTTGRLAAYDLKSRRFLGSLGPQGFQPDRVQAPDRFDPPEEYSPWNQTHVLYTSNTVYWVNPEERAAVPIFNAPAGDSVGAARQSQNVPLPNALVATRNYIHLLTAKGDPIWKTPYTPAFPKYDQIETYFLGLTNRYALIFAPANALPYKKLPSEFLLLAGEGTSITRTELPHIEQVQVHDLQEKLLCFAAPPAFLAFLRFGESDPSDRLPMSLIGAAMAIGVSCCLVAIWLARRYAFSSTAQIGWTILILLTGLPGLLTFLAVQEWPALEPCPSCGKRRLVTQAQCEHCAAPFSPAEKIGIEIFEPLPN